LIPNLSRSGTSRSDDCWYGPLVPRLREPLHFCEKLANGWPAAQTKSQKSFRDGCDTRPQKVLDFDSEVDRDVPIAIYTKKHRAGTARSTFPIVQKLFVIGMIASIRKEDLSGPTTPKSKKLIFKNMMTNALKLFLKRTFIFLAWRARAA